MNTEVDEDTVIIRKKKGNNTSATTSAKTPTTLLDKGLMRTKVCKTSVEITEMIVPLINKQFTMTAKVTTELLAQMSAYFVFITKSTYTS